MSTDAVGGHYALLDFNYSLVGWWRMEGNYNDDSGQGNNGACAANCPTYTAAGKYGGAYSFDKTVHQNITVAQSASLDKIRQNMTISAWIKPNAGYGTEFDDHIDVVSRWGSAGANNAAYLLGVNSGGYVKFFTHNGVSSSRLSSLNTIPTDEWTHIVGTRDGTSMKVYINGVLDNTLAGGVTPQASQYNLLIGSEPASMAFFDGLIDDVVIFNRVLSAGEVASLYNATVNRYDINFTNQVAGYYYYKGRVADTDGATNVTEGRYLEIYFPPTQTTNNGAQASSFAGYNSTTIQNVAHYVWHSNNNGMVRWQQPVNLYGINNLDNIVKFGTKYVSIDSAAGTALDTTANITFQNVECAKCTANNIVYATGTYSSRATLQAQAKSCLLAGNCSNFRCSGTIGDCTFDVTGFTGYAYGGNTNLTINDTTEATPVYNLAPLVFYAYYVDATTGSLITGASCNVTDVTGTYVMSQNTLYYNYSKQAGLPTAIQPFNVTCAKAGYTTLTANDTANIIPYPPAPEFPAWALLLAVGAVAVGVVGMRRK
jgi:hypothetical protein